ncbi:MAG TPA: hypothetical protein VHW09_27315 [Bryobacteraceae bacterium]|nr:hypothetical protein [Bryobacteraceae bacterium]
MRKYSEFFQTLHDEQTPTGTLGRGTHYSIFRAVVFGDEDGNMLGDGRFCDFAVIWDEDHDDRVIEPIEKIYFAGLLPLFLMFGERKGGFTAIAGSGEFPRRELLLSRLNAITSSLEIGDSWPSQIVDLEDPDNPIISADREKVTLYLSNLMMLWKLGLKPAKFQFTPIPNPA